MNSIAPIVLEALFYIFLILSAPAIWWLFSIIGEMIAYWLFPVTKVIITVEEEGKTSDIEVDLDNRDKLVQTLLKAKSRGANGAS